MVVSVKRTHDVKAPFDLFIELGNDWTHFPHVHKKSHKEFHLLYKNADREFFIYKARWLHPLPFFTNYLVIRENLPDRSGYQQLYLNTRTGAKHYLCATNIPHEGGVRNIGEYIFSVSSFWKRFPNLFLWLFKKRMRVVVEEDNAVLKERMEIGGLTNPACAPRVPASFDIMTEFLGQARQLKPEVQLEFYEKDDLRGRKSELANPPAIPLEV